MYAQRKGVSFVVYFMMLSVSKLCSVKWRTVLLFPKTVVPSFWSINCKTSTLRYEILWSDRQLPNILLSLSEQKMMYTAGLSKTLVIICQITQRYVPEDHCSEGLKFHGIWCYVVMFQRNISPSSSRLNSKPSKKPKWPSRWMQYSYFPSKYQLIFTGLQGIVS